MCIYPVKKQKLKNINKILKGGCATPPNVRVNCTSQLKDIV